MLPNRLSTGRADPQDGIACSPLSQLESVLLDIDAWLRTAHLDLRPEGSVNGRALMLLGECFVRPDFFLMDRLPPGYAALNIHVDMAVYLMLQT